MTAQLIPAGGIDKIPPFDPRSGEHYWIFPVAFHIRDPVAFYDETHGPALFDRENLVYAQAVGCFYCEQPYSERLASRRCPGRQRE